MDLNDVLAEMREAGYAFDAAWFAPHFEFRFPLVGQVQSAGVELTLRNALEPWHVMGEEGAPGGTVRYVDSSLERIEVRVTGLNESRYVVTVNGRALPMQPTGIAGEFVAGVRYKAWAPPSALHPTIGVHAPLVFDIVDTWMKPLAWRLSIPCRASGRTQLRHLPDQLVRGREPPPVALLPHGPHARASCSVPPATIKVAGSKEFPFTLDLRVVN